MNVISEPKPPRTAFRPFFHLTGMTFRIYFGTVAGSPYHVLTREILTDDTERTGEYGWFAHGRMQGTPNLENLTRWIEYMNAGRLFDQEGRPARIVKATLKDYRRGKRIATWSTAGH